MGNIIMGKLKMLSEIFGMSVSPLTATLFLASCTDNDEGLVIVVFERT